MSLAKCLRLSVLCMLVFLASCSRFSGWKPPISNQNTGYMNAQNIAPLRIPPGMSAQGFQATNPVPVRQYPESMKSIDIKPPGIIRD